MAEITGFACLEDASAGVSGLLEIAVDDVSKLDAPSMPIYRHREDVGAGRFLEHEGMPCIPFRFSCASAAVPLMREEFALSARLFVQGSGQIPRSLKAGDFATARRVNVPATLDGPFDLYLRRIGGVPVRDLHRELSR